jgi:hypothetical protein
MSTPTLTAPASGGRLGPWFVLALVALMAALTAAGTRSRVRERERTREAPKERGLHYEDHVLAATNLPRTVALEGGTLRSYPLLYVPQTTLPARYYKSPTGYAGGARRDRKPHPSAPKRWSAIDVGGYRIPDAIETRADGSQVLYELKCPSPWLVFDKGNPWAGHMQAAFASQALAYFAWAEAGPRRSIVYGYCGLAAPWAVAILGYLRSRFQVQVEIRPGFRATGFLPANGFMGRVVQETLTSAALGAIGDLAPEQALGATYDVLKD